MAGKKLVGILASLAILASVAEAGVTASKYSGASPSKMRVTGTRPSTCYNRATIYPEFYGGGTWLQRSGAVTVSTSGSISVIVENNPVGPSTFTARARVRWWSTLSTCATTEYSQFSFTRDYLSNWNRKYCSRTGSNNTDENYHFAYIVGFNRGTTTIPSNLNPKGSGKCQQSHTVGQTCNESRGYTFSDRIEIYNVHRQPCTGKAFSDTLNYVRQHEGGHMVLLGSNSDHCGHNDCTMGGYGYSCSGTTLTKSGGSNSYASLNTWHKNDTSKRWLIAKTY